MSPESEERHDLCFQRTSRLRQSLRYNRVEDLTQRAAQAASQPTHFREAVSISSIRRREMVIIANSITMVSFFAYLEVLSVVVESAF